MSCPRAQSTADPGLQDHCSRQHRGDVGALRGQDDGAELDVAAMKFDVDGFADLSLGDHAIRHRGAYLAKAVEMQGIRHVLSQDDLQGAGSMSAWSTSTVETWSSRRWPMRASTYSRALRRMTGT